MSKVVLGGSTINARFFFIFQQTLGRVQMFFFSLKPSLLKGESSLKKFCSLGFALFEELANKEINRKTH